MKALHRNLTLLLVGNLMAIAAVLFMPAAFAAESGEPLFNGSFETVESTADPAFAHSAKPTSWDKGIYTGSAVLTSDEQNYRTGTRSIKIEHASESRTALFQDVALKEKTPYTLKFSTRLDNVVSGVNGVYVRRMFFDASGTRIGNTYPSAKQIGTTDWTETSIDFTTPPETVRMRVELFFDTGTGTAWFDGVSLAHTDSMVQTVQMDRGTVSLTPGQTFKLTPLVSPASSEHNFTWTSSNTEIASVTDGIVHAVAEGRTLIKAISSDGKLTAQTSVSVIPETKMQQFQSLRERAAKKLTIPEGVHPNADYVRQFIEQKVSLVHNEQNTGFMDTLNRAEDRTYLWADRASETDPYITLYSYGRLKDMAIVYSTPGSPLYRDTGLRDDIIGGIEWMFENRYSEKKPVVVNWFVWEIAIPQTLGELMILMHDDLSEQQLNNYIRAIDHFVPDPTLRTSLDNPTFRETGANLLNKCYAVALRGLVGDSSEKIELALAPVGNEYRYVTIGEGIYSDGSIIQHTNVAYNGGYGQSYISQAEQLLYMFVESPWELTDPLIQNVYDAVASAFDPFIYNGRFMQMVKGRANSEGSDSAKATILAVLQLAETAPPEKVLPLKQMVKAWILEDTSNDYTTGLTVYQRSLYEKLMNNNSIVPREEGVGHTQFANMDRTLHKRSGWELGLSLFSERVAAFEYGNTENIKGWFTGAGMTYLYDADKNQFGDYYWPTVDSFRLPGTTTDRSGEGVTPGEWQNYAGTKSWVGGTTIGEYGAIGMEFSMSSVTKSSLTGKKSWFAFDDEVIAVGSGITSTDGRLVETIIENRKIRNDASNELVVDGSAKSMELGWNETLNNPEWTHLEGNVVGSDIGYVFPDNQNITAIRESRTGSYYDLNHRYGTKTPATRNFVSLAFNHGINPIDASYSYILLPGKSTAGTAAYSAKPDVKILSRTNAVHAVQENNLGITAANFWNAGTAGFITSKQPASAMVLDSADSWSVSVSDPTHKQSTIELHLDKTAVTVIGKDPTIEVLQTAPIVIIQVDVAGSKGASHEITFGKDTTGPVISVTSDGHALETGEPIAISRIDSRSVSITAVDKGNEPVSLSITLDGSAIQSQLALKPYQLAIGDHKLVVRAEDKAGNKTEQDYSIRVGMEIALLDESLSLAENNGWFSNRGVYVSLLNHVISIQKENDEKSISASLIRLEKRVSFLAGKQVQQDFADLFLEDLSYLRNQYETS